MFPDDYAVYTVAIQHDSSAIQKAMRDKQWDEAHKISVRMMSCLARINAYATARQAEEAKAAEEALRDA